MYRWLFLILVFGGLTAAPVHGQGLPAELDPFGGSEGDEEAAGGSEFELPESVEVVEEKQTAFRKKFGFPPAEGEGTPEEIRLVRLIYEVDTAYANQLTALRELSEITDQLQSRKNPRQWKEVISTGILEKEAISLKNLDQLHAIRDRLQEQLSLARQEIIRADRNLDLARQAYNRERSQAPAEASGRESSGTVDRALTSQARELIEQSATETYILRQLQARLSSLKQKHLSGKVERFDPFFVSFIPKVTINPDQVEKEKKKLEQKKRELEKSLKMAQDEVGAAERRVSDLTSALPAEPSPLELARLLLLEQRQEAARARLSLNQAWMQHHNLEREFLQDRIDFFRGELNRREMMKVEQRLLPEFKNLQSEVGFMKTRLNQVEEKLARIRSQAEATSPERQAILEAAADAAYDHFQVVREEVYSVQAILAKADIFLRELQTRTDRIDLEAVTLRAGNIFSSAWNYELFRLNENRFTISTLFWISLALVLAFAGCWLISLMLARLIFPRFRVSTGRSAALGKLVFYVILALAVVIVFAAFGFPLTSLTVASGILALAIGIGSQDIIKNFMSGLILLVERPIHHGDIIELGERVLIVDSVGIRSTRMRDFDSSEKIVPNSQLIENIITNRTLSDDGVRTEVEVGVAYGSPTRKVSDLLLQAAGQIENVRKEPAPFVIFTSFGDNALIFTVYFWCKADSRLSTASEVRHQIAETLTAEDITIAFPQRDLHLDTLRPLQIEFQNPDSPTQKEE